MENASKALIMAGGVLLSLLVIGTLVFMFTQLSDLKQTEEDSKAQNKIEIFYNNLDSYVRAGLRGSDILSLANLIDDFNTRYAGENEEKYGNEGYDKITLTVKYDLSKMIPMDNSKFFKYGDNTGTFNQKNLIKAKAELDKAVESKGKEYPKKPNSTKYSKTYKDLAAMRYEELVKFVAEEINITDLTAIDKEISRLQNGIISGTEDCIEYYNALVAEQKSVKSSVRFKNPTVEENKFKRIISLTYEQN